MITTGIRNKPAVSRSTSSVLKAFASGLRKAVDTVKEAIHDLCPCTDMGGGDTKTDLGPGARSGPSVVPLRNYA